jgi:hypothetical protein
MTFSCRYLVIAHMGMRKHFINCFVSTLMCKNLKFNCTLFHEFQDCHVTDRNRKSSFQSCQSCLASTPSQQQSGSSQQGPFSRWKKDKTPRSIRAVAGFTDKASVSHVDWTSLPPFLLFWPSSIRRREAMWEDTRRAATTFQQLSHHQWRRRSPRRPLHDGTRSQKVVIFCSLTTVVHSVVLSTIRSTAHCTGS